MVVIDAVDEMDFELSHAAYRVDGRTRPPYDPTMMVALLLYAYARGDPVFAGDRARLRGRHRVPRLGGQQRPDHATIARFVERHQEPLAGLFGDVLTLCARSGLAKVGVIAVDSTKVQANASRNANRDYEQLAREIVEEAKQRLEAERAAYPQPVPRSRRERVKEAKRRVAAARDTGRSHQPH